MNNKNKKGIVLTEALIAIAVLAISASVVSFVINNANRRIAENQHRLMMENFFLEAVEIVKNTRDSNRLVRPEGIIGISDPECLLVINPVNTANFNEPCSNFDQFAVGPVHYPIVNEDGNKVLTRKEGLEKIYNVNGNYQQLSEADAILNNGIDSGYRRNIFFTEVNQNEGEAKFEVNISLENGSQFLKRSYHLFN